jgi:protease II
MPFPYGKVAPCTNEDYHADEIMFAVSTPFVYEEIYTYSKSKNECKILQAYEYTGPAIHTNKYDVETVEVPATDMTTIPLTIIGPKKRKLQKLLFNFYGCYGMAYRVPFDNVTIAALEKGWTICHAHVRGGNEKGSGWHKQAQGDSRNRSWMDVEECVGYLLREQYTHPALLFLASNSAGAINLWNIISRKPYLYKAAIFRNPFLDVLSSLMDPDQPLSNTDYE